MGFKVTKRRKCWELVCTANEISFWLVSAGPSWLPANLQSRATSCKQVWIGSEDWQVVLLQIRSRVDPRPAKKGPNQSKLKSMKRQEKKPQIMQTVMKTLQLLSHQEKCLTGQMMSRHIILFDAIRLIESGQRSNPYAEQRFLLDCSASFCTFL